VRNSSRKYKRTVLRVVIASLACSCAVVEASGPVLPLGAVQVAAPPEYAEWHRKTTTCSGLSGEFRELQWYVVPGVSTFATSRGPQVGMWENRGGIHRIIIAGQYAGNEMVVRHEILHALLGRAGHPASYFVSRCHLTWESWDGSTAATELPGHDGTAAH